MPTVKTNTDREQEDTKNEANLEQDNSSDEGDGDLRRKTTSCGVHRGGSTLASRVTGGTVPEPNDTEPPMFVAVTVAEDTQEAGPFPAQLNIHSDGTDQQNERNIPLEAAEEEDSSSDESDSQNERHFGQN